MFHVPARPLSGLHSFDAHLPGMVACSGYHRFTLPRRDTVMVATSRTLNGPRSMRRWPIRPSPDLVEAEPGERQRATQVLIRLVKVPQSHTRSILNNQVHRRVVGTHTTHLPEPAERLARQRRCV